MITIYVDPSDANQVMAYYNGCQPGDPAVWTDQGFIEKTVSEENPLYREIRRNKRDCRFNDDVVTPRVNPVQPIPNPADVARNAARESGIAKLKTLGLSSEEIAAMGLR